LLSVKTGSVAEVTRKADPILSVRLDLEQQSLPQTSLAEVLRPLASQWVKGDLRASASRPHRDLVGMATLVVVTVSSFPSLESFSRTVATTAPSFFSLTSACSLIDPVQLDLIERRIAWYGRFVSVPFRVKSRCVSPDMTTCTPS
jgi:hypothetical protein